MKKLFCLALFLLFFSFTCAATYWVSPTGTASWNNCKNDSPLNGEAACSISTANSNAAAGDTVYLRGGNYTSNGIGVIAPAKSGTSASNRIIFVAYSGEIPIMTNTAPPGSGYGYGFFFEKNSYIKIDGVIFRDCPYWGYFLYSSSYNEITNCTFDSSNYAGAKGTGVLIFPACPPTYDCWNTNNWIHGNTFSKRVYPNDSCGETVDLLRAGDAYGDGTVVENDNYNTIEDNVFSYAGHTLLDTFGNYNVIRNNIFHNEPWITDCNTGQINSKFKYDTSSTPLEVGTGTKSLIVSSGKSYSNAVGIISTDNPANAMNGWVNSYDNQTGLLVVGVTASSGSGTYNNWTISKGNYPFYENSAYNGKFGHRGVALSDDYWRAGTYILFERNRAGHASNNPGNDGAHNLDIRAPKNIVRYNFIYNAMATGIYLAANSAVLPCDGTRKEGSGCGGVLNKIYNNTIYHNGYGYNWRVYGSMNMLYSGQGIAQMNCWNCTAPTGNTIKNNIVYDNKEGDICWAGLRGLPCSAKNWDTVENNWLTSNGDPKFINPDISDATSLTLPNLSVQSDSPVVNEGTYLTQANGSGENIVVLRVDDAWYFQDGSWGSELARAGFYADWIAVGRVDNAAQIASIDYNTNSIILKTPLSWNDNDPVWLYKDSSGKQVLYGNAPDIGAHEYVETSPVDSVCTTYTDRYTTTQIDQERLKWVREEITLKELIIKAKIWKYCQ